LPHVIDPQFCATIGFSPEETAVEISKADVFRTLPGRNSKASTIGASAVHGDVKEKERPCASPQSASGYNPSYNKRIHMDSHYPNLTYN